MVKWSVQTHSRCCRTPGSRCQETALGWWWHWLVSDYLMLDNMFVLSTPSTQSSMSSILSILRVSTHKSLMNTIGAANVMALQTLEHFWNANSLWTDADLWLQWCKTISVYKKLWPWCTNSVLEQRGFMLLLREWCDRSVKSGLYSFIILIPHTYCSTDIGIILLQLLLVLVYSTKVYEHSLIIALTQKSLEDSHPDWLCL